MSQSTPSIIRLPVSIRESAKIYAHGNVLWIEVDGGEAIGMATHSGIQLDVLVTGRTQSTPQLQEIDSHANLTEVAETTTNSPHSTYVHSSTQTSSSDTSESPSSLDDEHKRIVLFDPITQKSVITLDEKETPLIPPKSPRLTPARPVPVPTYSTLDVMEQASPNDVTSTISGLPTIILTPPDSQTPEIGTYYNEKNRRPRRASIGRLLLRGYVAKEFPEEVEIRQNLLSEIPDECPMEYLDVPANSEVWALMKDVSRSVARRRSHTHLA